mgnify:CR=1 FL=1
MIQKTPRAKVFCVGFQKTGTSSLGIALERLGYRVAGFYPFRDLAAKREVAYEELLERAVEVAREVDAAQDMPWPILYADLDRIFPGSKFIHVMRDRDSWINSVIGDFSNSTNAIRRFIYKVPYPQLDPEAYLARYDRHNRDVGAYFADRESDFLSLDLSKGEVDWAPICDFLGHTVPDISWPHANTKRAKRLKLFWWRNRGKALRMFGGGKGGVGKSDL